MMNMSLIILEVKYGAVDTDDSPFNSYCIVNFSSSSYTPQSDFIIDK